MYLSKERLQEMEHVDIQDVELDTLVDICGLDIDIKKPVPNRIEEYIGKIAEIKY